MYDAIKHDNDRAALAPPNLGAASSAPTLTPHQ